MNSPKLTTTYSVALDLFEVVDRRAKLVVGENPEEQSNFQSPGIDLGSSECFWLLIFKILL